MPNEFEEKLGKLLLSIGTPENHIEEDMNEVKSLIKEALPEKKAISDETGSLSTLFRDGFNFAISEMEKKLGL